MARTASNRGRQTEREYIYKHLNLLQALHLNLLLMLLYFNKSCYSMQFVVFALVFVTLSLICYLSLLYRSWLILLMHIVTCDRRCKICQIQCESYVEYIKLYIYYIDLKMYYNCKSKYFSLQFYKLYY